MTTSPSNTGALKPCPFCGGPALSFHTVLPGPINECWGVCCATAGKCQASIDACGSEAEAIEAWNTRVPDPALVEALREARRTIAVMAECLSPEITDALVGDPLTRIDATLSQLNPEAGE